MIDLRRDAPGEGVPVLAVGGHDGVVGCERLHHPDGDGLLADVEVHEAADLGGAVQLDAALLEPADAQHLPVEPAGVLDVEGFAHAPSSRVDRSPSGRPSSRARSSRRTILPLRVLGRCSAKESSFGGDGGPEARPAESDQLVMELSVGSWPGRRVTNAFTSWPTMGSGLPMTPASATAGCSMSALSTSNGPIR